MELSGCGELCVRILVGVLSRNMEEDLLDEGDHVRAAVAKVQTKVISQVCVGNHQVSYGSHCIGQRL